MSAQANFDAAIARSKHLLLLYDLIHDNRQRGIRSDWASNFKELMHWPDGEAIVRIDGLGRNSLLIVREAVGVSREQFSHKYASELLRAAIVAAVSALDRYIHDLVVENSWKLLSRAEVSIPTDLKKLELPVLDTKRALERLRSDKKARPGNLIKRAIQEQLHSEFTFQKPDMVEKAMRMLGVSDFWTKVAAEMPGQPPKAVVIEKLREVANRRNQIVHEADLERKLRAKQVTLRDLTRPTANAHVLWIEDFAAGLGRVVSAAQA